MKPEYAIMLSMAAVAAACSLPGTLLVLRKMVMVGDAISHVLLLGIVLAYFLVSDPASPLLLIGAALAGFVTVILVETLQKTRLVKEDAAIGLVFPALFSIATILASIYLRSTHLDIDRVLLGNAELIPFDRMQIGNIKLPRALVVMTSIFTINFVLLIALNKEIAISIFDAGLAASLGFAPVLLHYGLMACISLTTVAAFDAVGPVLVLAFFAVPTATARLLTDRLPRLLVLSVVIAVTCAVLGTRVAFMIDTTIAGTIASLLGLVFVTVYLTAPREGLVAAVLRRRRQRREFYETLLLIHLLTHEGTAEEAEETGITTMPRHLAWTAADANSIAARLSKKGLIRVENDCWRLTDPARLRANDTLRFNSYS